MKSVEVLMHEHRVIEHGLSVLEAVADRLERGESVPTDKVTALLDFFRVFARPMPSRERGRDAFPRT
jgi:hemerythrin-like domain-containing protein